jgi:glycosyltransferase involved in cell wall biosynthesis
MKFAVVSPYLPPRQNGQAVVIHRLLSHLSSDNYCTISSWDYNAGVVSESTSLYLSGKSYKLNPGFRIKGGYRFRTINRLYQKTNAVFDLISHVKQIVHIIRKESCRAVVAFTGDLVDLPAAFIASRLTGVAFFPYILDYYSYPWLDSFSRAFARFFEPALLKGATQIIVVNEFLGEALRQRYHVTYTVIRNPCDLSEYAASDSDATAAYVDERRIVFTGGIYEAHFDAFRNLLRAIDLLKEHNIKLHIYTGQSPEILESKGIRGSMVWHGHESPDSIPRIQQQADILFLPLAFDSRYPELINTSSPGKMGEYLASGRPILVHAPKDSFIAWYFRKYEAGLVVDESDPVLLADAVRSLLTNPHLGARMSKNARERAIADFDISVSQTKFMNLLSLPTMI